MLQLNSEHDKGIIMGQICGKPKRGSPSVSQILEPTIVEVKPQPQRRVSFSENSIYKHRFFEDFSDKTYRQAFNYDDNREGSPKSNKSTYNG